MEDGLVGLVGEGDVLEGYVAVDRAEDLGAGGLVVLGSLGEDLAGAVESGDGFGELGADGDQLRYRGDHEGQEHDVGDVAAGGEVSGDDLVRAEVHDECADDAEDCGGGERHQGLRGEGRDDVLEEAIGSGGEDVGLALLRRGSP